jgi:hypothetical protein
LRKLGKTVPMTAGERTADLECDDGVNAHPRVRNALVQIYRESVWLLLGAAAVATVVRTATGVGIGRAPLR